MKDTIKNNQNKERMIYSENNSPVRKSKKFENFGGNLVFSNDLISRKKVLYEILNNKKVI
jgi:hypothetical protein